MMLTNHLKTTYVLAGYMAVVSGHMLEHGVQAVQVFALGWEREEALGLAGLAFPALVSSEALHYFFAAFTTAGIALLLPAFSGTARVLWAGALVVEFWHHFEHALLLYQRVSGDFFFGASEPATLVQTYVMRVELHLFYNAVVFVPLVFAAFLYLLARMDDFGAVEPERIDVPA